MMKKIVATVLFFTTQLIGAQIDEPIEVVDGSNNIYDIKGLDTQPEFPGGIKKFYELFNTNFNYTEELDDDTTWKMIVMFVIEKDGSLTDIKILRDIGHGSGKEAIRVLKIMPKWIPGRQNDKIVRVKYTLPINIESPSFKAPTKK